MSDEPGDRDESSAAGFSSEVREALSLELEGFHLDIQAWHRQERPDSLDHLYGRLKSCRNTLFFARRSDGVLIADELQVLLDACADADAGEIDELALMLADATQAFQDHLSFMHRRSELSSLLPFLSVLNDCRASCGRELLSASVVDAVGIPSFEWRRAQDDAVIRSIRWYAFRDRIGEYRSDVQHAILEWFGSTSRSSVQSRDSLHALKQLRDAFDSMAQDDTATVEASAWNDLFSAAVVVIDAIVTGQRNDGVAVRRLFAHLERCLAEVMSRDWHAPPVSLLQNFLWYVAEYSGESVSAIALRERFQLHRLASADGTIQLQAGMSPVFNPTGSTVNVHLNAETADKSKVQAALIQCRVSTSALRAQLLEALVPGGQTRKQLPDEGMLRSLHDLNQSLQILDVHELLVTLTPLQKLALYKQRLAESLDAKEIREFSLFTEHLEATLVGDQTAIRSVADVEKNTADSLRDVFAEEARYLVERMYDLLEGQAGMSDPLRIAGVLAHLHTLKGSARMAGRVRIAEQAHILEGDVQHMDLDIGSQIKQLRRGRVQLQALLLNDQAERQLNSRVAQSFSPTASPGVDDPASSTNRVPDTDYEETLRNTAVVGVSLARLGEGLQRLGDVTLDLESTALQWRRLLDESDRSLSIAELELLNDLEAAREHLSDELQHAGLAQRKGARSSAVMQQSLIRSRRLPAEDFRNRLQRVLDDASEPLEARLLLVVEGGQTLLDRALFRQLLPVFEHLIRNARIHGIETISERLALGKPSMGEVTLSIQADGVDLIAIVADDGRGVDSIAINKARQARGEPTLETVAALQHELCRTGFSTLSDASALAGRGLGLSAVRQTVEQLEGRLGLWTRPGQGTRVTVTVPQPVVINPSVLVRSGRRLYALPAERVKHIEPRETNVDASFVGKESERCLVLERLLSVGPNRREGNALDFRESGPTGRLDRKHQPASRRRLHVEHEGAQLVIEVEQILGHRELIAQPLGQQLAGLKRFTGGGVLPDGQQVLMLDLDQMLDSASLSSAKMPSGQCLQYSESTALVVDDSLTMRVAASRYLEARGVRVSAARDGVEALAMIEKCIPSLLIVDIDMPRLNGFELLSRLRLRLSNKLPPTIVISSRARQEDRNRASALGANAFLVKPWNNDELNDALVVLGVRLPDITIA